jgi:xanthine/uracil permease
MGFENPNAWMLPAISAICASLCVRALRADGMSRATGHISKRNRSTVDIASALLISSLRSFLASLLALHS